MGIEFVVKLIKKTSQNINSTGRAIFYSNSPIWYAQSPFTIGYVCNCKAALAFSEYHELGSLS